MLKDKAGGRTSEARYEIHGRSPTQNVLCTKCRWRADIVEEHDELPVHQYVQRREGQQKKGERGTIFLTHFLDNWLSVEGIMDAEGCRIPWLEREGSNETFFENVFLGRNPLLVPFM